MKETMKEMKAKLAPITWTAQNFYNGIESIAGRALTATVTVDRGRLKVEVPFYKAVYHDIEEGVDDIELAVFTALSEIAWNSREELSWFAHAESPVNFITKGKNKGLPRISNFKAQMIERGV